MRIYRNREIEEIARDRHVDLERVTGRPLTVPVPIDQIAELVLHLDFLWEPIEELPGEKILGGLVAEKRLIILNENRRGLFEATRGLERSTKGHEMGHWDLFVEKGSLDHPSLFQRSDRYLYRSTPEGPAEVVKGLGTGEDKWEALRHLRDRADEPDEARAVNRYAAALSMPEELLFEAAVQVDRTRWPNLYRLAERFDVSISAMVVRLQQLNLLHVGKGRTLYPSKEAAFGQLTFQF